jgi:aromatic-L-amino-acid/L-tryptophan decarboxylase
MAPALWNTRVIGDRAGVRVHLALAGNDPNSAIKNPHGRASHEHIKQKIVRLSRNDLESQSMNPLDISTSQFRRLADQIATLAAQYLDELDARRITPDIGGDEITRLFRSELPERGMGEEALRELQEVVGNSRAQNGRFFGYVLGSGELVGAAAEILTSVLNQNGTAWRSGPACATIEKIVVGWLAEAIGCTGFKGSLTGGGSTANLMGLAMAREAQTPANEKGCGSANRVVYASNEIHMSIPKAVALLGIGRDNLRLIATDNAYRIIPDELDRAIRRDRAAGKIPVAVVASAGTVNTGAIDPLQVIEEIAREHHVWFHIDGAYGALASMAQPDKFIGMDRADSISLDPHKWLYQSLDCGCLLYRDARAAQAAFSHSGDYARPLCDDSIEGFAFFEESLELSRRFRSLKVWLSLRYHGFQAFRDSISLNIAQARRLADAIRKESKLELIALGDLSAMCFRYVNGNTTPLEELNRANASILKRIVERGNIYLSNASLGGRFCLRACIVNHRTTDADIDAVVPEVLASASDLA